MFFIARRSSNVCNHFTRALNTSIPGTVNLVPGVVGKLTPNIGSSIELTHTYSQDEVTSFANISGDNNPIHVDPKFASTTPFKKTIVHGIYSSSLFSRMLGSTMHGSVYVGQTLRFLKPVFTDSTVQAKISVVQVEKRRRGNLLTCSTTVHIVHDNDVDVLAVTGEAQVLIPF